MRRYRFVLCTLFASLLLASCGGGGSAPKGAAPLDPGSDEQQTPVVTPPAVEGQPDSGDTPQTQISPSTVEDGPQGLCNLPSSPKLIYSGVDANKPCFGTVHISAVTSDDVGVNYMVLYINGELATEKAAPAMEFAWDTTKVADGPYDVVWNVRDEAHVFRFMVSLTVDNNTDHAGPEIVLTIPEGKKLYDYRGRLLDPYYTDPVTIKATASDPSGVASLTLSDSHQTYVATKGIGTTQAEIEVTLSADRETKFSITTSARDTLANESHNPTQGGHNHYLFNIVNYLPLRGHVVAANGRPLGGVHVSIPDAPWVADGVPELNADGGLNYWYCPHETDTVDLYANGSYYRGDVGEFHIGYFKLGKYSALLERGGRHGEVPVELHYDYRPGDENRELKLAMPAESAQAHPTRLIGVVSGDNDRVEDILGRLREAQGEWPTFDPSLVEVIDGNDSLAGGEPSFAELLAHENMLYRYRYLVVNGGVHDLVPLLTPTRLALLRKWIGDGGGLVCTAQSVDMIEALYPEKLWLSADSIDGFSAIPEPPGSSEVGPALFQAPLMWDENPWADVLSGEFPTTVDFADKWNCLRAYNAAAGVHNWEVLDVPYGPGSEVNGAPLILGFEEGLGSVSYCARPCYVGGIQGGLVFPEPVAAEFVAYDDM